MRKDSKFFEAMSDILVQNLKESIEDGEFVDVTDMRQIGKTTTLINFAKANGYAVIVQGECFARNLRKRFSYMDISSQHYPRLGSRKAYLIDEAVDVSRLRADGINVIGGYINYGL